MSHWTVSCRNIANDETTVISTVTDEGTRDRFVEKEYCLDDDVGDIWTDRITIRITDTKESTGICHINQWTIMTDPSVIELPEGQDRELWEFIPNMEKECL